MVFACRFDLALTASDWSGVRIAWDNGKDQFFHHNNMTQVEVAKSKLQ